jgi:hypothetical protein
LENPKGALMKPPKGILWRLLNYPETRILWIYHPALFFTKNMKENLNGTRGNKKEAHSHPQCGCERLQPSHGGG